MKYPSGRREGPPPADEKALRRYLTEGAILIHSAQHAVALAEAAVLNAHETRRAAIAARQTARSLRDSRNRIL